MNITSQDVTAIYPQYFYESLFKTALDDKDFEFQLTTAPFPVFAAFKDREASAQSLDYVFMLAIALALIPCMVVSFVLNEREKQLKHQQLVSGMSLMGYWTANLLSDVVASYLPILLIMMFNFAFSLNIEYAYLFLLLYPLAVIPFSYLTSFAFGDDTTAQICTLFVHFITAGLLMSVVFVLQLIPITAMLGDKLRYVGLLVPSYCVTHAIFTSQNLPQLVKSRSGAIAGDYPNLPEWPDELWAWENLKADLMALILHFVVGLILVAVIESPLIDFFGEMQCCAAKEFPRDDLDLDEDVEDEEERIANMRIDGEYVMKDDKKDTQIEVEDVEK